MSKDYTDTTAIGQAKEEKKLDLRANTHSFDTDIAQEYGIDIALMYKHITYLVNCSKDSKRNFHEGRYWFYDTLETIANHFSYWSQDQVKRIIKKMFDMNLILKGNFNKTSFDRTVWYTLNYTIKKEDSKREIHVSKSGNGNRQMDMAESPNGYGGIATPIPNTIPNTKKILSKDNIEKDAEASTPVFLEEDSSKELKLPHAEKPPLEDKAISSSASIKKEIQKNVFISDDEHKNLIALYSREVVHECYRMLSDWKEDTPKKKWKPSDFRSIKRWVALAYAEKQKKLESLKGFKGKTPQHKPAVSLKEDLENHKKNCKNQRE